MTEQFLRLKSGRGKSFQRVSDAEVARCCNDEIRRDPATGRGCIITNLARDLRDLRRVLAGAVQPGP